MKESQKKGMTAATAPRIGTITRQKLVNESKVEYATWGINHVQGCLHDCKYCYARTEAKAHGRIACDAEWTEIALVENAAALVGGQLDRMRKKVDRIHLCFTTDPFMWDAETGALVPEVAESTLAIIRAVNERGIPVSVLTKGVYPTFDVRSLHPGNHYGITAVSLSEDFRLEWEPGAPPVSERIAGLRRIAEQAAWTWVSVEPYPTPNIDDTAPNIGALLESLDFVDKFILGRLNYTPAVTEYLKSVDPDFYARIARQATLWCRINKKELHIKSGTPLHSESTVGLLDAGSMRKIKVRNERQGSGIPESRVIPIYVVERPAGVDARPSETGRCTRRISDAGLVSNDGGIPFSIADIRHQASLGILTRAQHAKALGVSVAWLDQLLDG